MDSDENLTITYLRPDETYPTEMDPVTRDYATVDIRVHRHTVAEWVVGQPFDADNMVRRVLPEKALRRMSPDQRMHLDGPEKNMIRQQVRRRLIMEAGQVYTVPKTALRALRTLQCSHEFCLQRPLDCTRPTHADFHQVIAGLAPHIQVVGESAPPPQHPSIEEAPAAPQMPILEAIDPKPAKTPEQALLERARARRAGGTR
jgi:hypothetical protein